MSDKLSALPLITTVQPNSRFYLTDPAEPVPADQSKAIEFLGLQTALGGLPTNTQDLYVAKNGDAANSGSLLSPFLTIGQAVAAIIAAGDASSSKFYTINVGSGTYTENVALPSFVVLRGYTAGDKPTYIDGIITIDTAHCSAVADNYIYIAEIGVDQINFTANVAGGFNFFATFTSVTFNYECRFNMTTSQLYATMFNCVQTDLSGWCYVMNNTRAYITLCNLKIEASGNTQCFVSNCKLAAFYTNHTSVSYVYACDVDGMGTGGSSTVNIDSVSYPKGAYSHGSSNPLVLKTPAVAVKYTPTTPADWPTPNPATVQAALDDLAASAGPVPSLSITTVQPIPGSIDDIPYLYTWFPIGGGMTNDIPSLRVGDGANSVSFVKVFTSIILDGIQASDITFNDLTELGTINGNLITSLESLSLPALTRVYGWLEFNSCSLIDTISVPVLTRVDGYISIVGCALVTLDLSSVEVVIGGIAIGSMPTLTSIDISGLLQLGDNFSAADNALTETAVDDILVKLASMDGTGGTTSYDNKDINLSGGTNATPSATGLAAKATLEARGCTVTVN